MKRSTFCLGLLGTLGTLAVAGASPALQTGSTAVRKVGNRFEEYVGKQQISDLEIQLIPFQEYYPKNVSGRIQLMDPLLKAYIAKPYSLQELKQSLTTTYTDETFIQRSVQIKDYHHFKKEILATAKQLGISKRELKALDIHDAIMVSGRILAQRMEYNKRMINSEEGELSLQESTDGIHVRN